jgi:hypothetical protein
VPGRKGRNSMSENAPVGEEQPRTRSRKRAEEALKDAEESAQKRAKEEREKAGGIGDSSEAKTTQRGPGKRR